MSAIGVEVEGRPRTKGSWRPINDRKRPGKTKLIPDSKRSKPWETLIKLKSREARSVAKPGEWPTAEPVGVWAVFIMPRPLDHWSTRKVGDGLRVLKDSAPVRPSGRVGDLDKLLRALLDGIQGVLILDDSAVCSITAEKVYEDATRRPGLMFHVEHLPSEITRFRSPPPS